MISSISQEQGGFQDGLSWCMTSFVLRESIQFVRECKYTWYACFNDDRKAFNVVWYESLMHKRLSESGIDNRTVLAFYLHQHDFTDSLRRTIYQWSNLTNRERWPRNVYVKYVCWLPDRCRWYGVVIVLLQWTYDALSAICNEYAVSGDTVITQTNVLVFNEHQKLTRERLFMLGDSIIPEASDYVHLGVKCDNFLSSQCCVRDACTKLQGTLLSITNSGFPVNCLNPIYIYIHYPQPICNL